jgi:hypothetical protein
VFYLGDKQTQIFPSWQVIKSGANERSALRHRRSSSHAFPILWIRESLLFQHNLGNFDRGTKRVCSGGQLMSQA